MKMTMGSQTGFSAPDSLSPFSALNFLRNYNQFLTPSGSNLVQVYHHYSCGASIADLPHQNPSPTGNFTFPPVLGAFQPYSQFSITDSSPLSDLKSTNIFPRRPRGEKKPIPEDQKDDRYYERRKRNNQAAKKSRDARKLREDQIALRATLLEHENAILRAQLLTLREETESLRQIILNQKKFSGKSLTTSGKKEPKLESSMETPPKWETDF